MNPDSDTADLDALERGDSLTVHIDGFDNKYLGRTTLGDREILVPGVLPGERVRGDVIRSWPSRILLKPVEILRSDADRVEPECRHFLECAGCQFQHIDYDRQLELKLERMRRFFREEDPATPLPLEPIVRAPDPYRYRNNIKLHGPGEPGFWKVRGYEMLRNEECPVCVDELEAALQEGRREGFRDYVDRGVENLLLRASRGGEVYVGPENREEASDETWLSEHVRHPLTGDRQEFEVPAHAFWQGSTPMIDALVEEVLRPVEALQPEVLLETYCGVGLFGLLGARAADHVLGVEEDPLSVRAARRNQRTMGLDNIRFVEGPTEDHLGRFLRRAPLDHTALIVDPPRSGLPKAVLRDVLEAPPARIVYVSCNPQSLARNLRALTGEAYVLDRLTPLDLFPQTKHLECVGDLRRAS